MPELGRRERRKRELRARILEAARESFAADGFHAARVAEICARADVAQKTFFNHFGSKQDVVREIARLEFEQVLVDLETLRKARMSTRDRLVAFFAHFAEHMTAQASPLHRELVTELVHVLSAADERSEQATRMHAAFEEIVRDGLVVGEVTRRHAPETLTEMILGAYYVLIFNYANLDSYPIAAQAEASARFLGDALAPHPDENPPETGNA